MSTTHITTVKRNELSDKTNPIAITSKPETKDTNILNNNNRSNENISNLENTNNNTNEDEKENKENDIKNKNTGYISQTFEDEQYQYKTYSGEQEMHLLQDLCASNLSEPYSVFTFRYFVNNWPHLCFLAKDKSKEDLPCVGLVVGRLRRTQQSQLNSGYIAMLVVDHSQRRKGLGTKLVRLTVEKMIELGAEQVVLETEVDNGPALHLYEKLGFVRDLRFRNYYLNGNDAYRLRLYLRMPVPLKPLQINY